MTVLVWIMLCRMYLHVTIDPPLIIDLVLSLLQVAIPLYYAAFQFSAPKLLANCQNYILSNYKDLEKDDPNHETLLHILDNAPQGKQQ